MDDKRYIDFYIDWYCMFYHLYEYDVQLGDGLYGEFREEFHPHFNMIRKSGEHTTFFGVNKEKSEERVKKIKNNVNHCLHDLYHILKEKEVSDLLFDPKEKRIKLISDQPSYGNRVLYELVNGYFNRAPYFPDNELLFVPVVDADPEVIEAFRKAFSGVDVKVYLIIDKETNKTYQLYITLDKEEEHRQKVKAYEKEHNIEL